MNERIKLLAEQAGVKINAYGRPIPASLASNFDEFAQLIVRECSGFVYNYPEKYLTRNQSAEICMSMEEHFGITE